MSIKISIYWGTSQIIEDSHRRPKRSEAKTDKVGTWSFQLLNLVINRESKKNKVIMLDLPTVTNFKSKLGRPT